MRKRWWEDGRDMPPERETFGEEEDKLKSKTGVKTRAQRGKQNGEWEAERKRQRSGANDRQWEQQRKNRGKRLGEKKYKLPTPYLLFSIKLIFSNGSCRSRLGGTSIPITMLPTHTAQ